MKVEISSISALEFIMKLISSRFSNSSKYISILICVLLLSCSNPVNTKKDPEAPEGMVYVKGGTFEMGDHFNEGSSYERPVHTIILDDFFIGKYEITQAEYASVTGNTPANDYGIGDNYPVYFVSWLAAATFCNMKSQLEGLMSCYNLDNWSCNYNANGYRLPTEAEWEYTARGEQNWEANFKYSGCNDESELDEYAWFIENNIQMYNGTKEVGTKLPNQLGVYDMSGNLNEWCNDWYDNQYYSYSLSTNPYGPNNGISRVIRGGSWCSLPFHSRVSYRDSALPSQGDDNEGFRILRRVVE